MAYVFYVKIGENLLPIKCEGYVQDQFLETNVRLVGIEGISEALYPELQADILSVKKENIDYYLCGTHKKTEEEASHEDQDEYEEESEEESEYEEPETVKKPTIKKQRRRSRFQT